MSESKIFNEAIKLSPDQRAAFLDQACAANPELRGEVESLLRAHDASGSFLQNDPARARGTIPLAPITERAGSVIGRYKLLQQIGEGGFGSVYMAEQREPVKRRVALKIIKLGMDTREVVARFEAERQALALMDHPNIAKVLDAGATDTGRPFFVMELVKGVPITEFCDLNHLHTHDRLGLFVQVCRAVQHAHQKGVIHRDIKPTNVLVTLHDGKPVPKVIDFGVAKALNQELTEKTLFTAYGHMIGTPQYMSPEQAEMSGLDVDTRADVYSLGVLLYELLTGTTPLEAVSLRKAAYAEMQRLIREQEAPRPSQRVSTLGERLSVVARDRGCEPSRLGAMLRGDLDWVVLKALEKERGRRYESADGFAADVQRFLGNEPVEAHPPSVGYRVRKFIRRNRGQVIAAGLMLGVLCLGLAGTVSGMFAARREADRETEAEMDAAAQRDAALREAAEKEIALKAVAAERAAAERERQMTAEAGDKFRRQLYASTANHIQAAWEANNFAHVQELLNKQQEDLRHFEWHFFDRLMHGESRTVKLEPVPANTQEAMRPKNVSQGEFGKLGVRRLFFSADGGIAAAAIGFAAFDDFERGVKGEQHPLPIWDLATGRILLNVPYVPGSIGDNIVNKNLLFDVSRDGKRLVISQYTRAPDRSRIEVWDVSAKQRRKTIDREGVIDLALSPDGRRLAVMLDGRPDPGGESLPEHRLIKIWDLDEDKEPLEFQRPLMRMGLRQSTFTADGKRFIVQSVSPIENGKKEFAKKGAERGPLQVVREPLQVVTFDAETGKQFPIRQLLTPGPWGTDDGKFGQAAVITPVITPSQFSADGNRIVATFHSSNNKSDDRTQVGVWEPDSQDPIAILDPKLPRNCIAIISPDGSRVAIWSWDVIQLWHLAKQKLRGKAVWGHTATLKGHTAPITSVAFRADGTRLISVDTNGTLKEWDVQLVERTGPIAERNAEAIPKSPPWLKGGGFQPAGFRPVQSKDGTRMVAARLERVVVGFDPDTKKAKKKSPDSTDIVVYDAAGNELPKFTEHKVPVTSLEISANGRFVISADRDKEVKVWETDTRRVVLQAREAVPAIKGPKFGSGGAMFGGGEFGPVAPPVANVQFSPDGRRLAAALPNGVKVWEADGFREIFAASDALFDVTWSPDGRRLLATTGLSPAENEPIRSLKVWDVDSRKELYAGAALAGFRFFSFDGQRLVLISTGKQGTLGPWDIRIVDVATGRELTKIKVPPSVGYWDFSPDWTRMAVTSPSREILVLDVATGNVVYRLNGHAMSTGERPPALAFSPDGKRLASARSGASAGIGPSGKSELILWDMTSGEEVMRLLGLPLSLSNPALPTFSSDGHRIEMGAAPARIFDATPHAVSPK